MIVLESWKISVCNDLEYYFQRISTEQSWTSCINIIKNSEAKLVFVRFISSRWNCSLRKKYVLFLDTKLIHWLKNIRKIDSLIVITNDVRDVITHTIHFQSCFDHIFVTLWFIDSMLCTHTKTSFNASRTTQFFYM